MEPTILVTSVVKPASCLVAFEGRLAARIRASAREVVSACTGAVWVGCGSAKELSEGSRVVNGVFELFEINVALLGH